MDPIIIGIIVLQHSLLELITANVRVQSLTSLCTHICILEMCPYVLKKKYALDRYGSALKAL